MRNFPDKKCLYAAIEALLFVSNEPMSVHDMALFLETSAADIEIALKDMQLRYSDAERGIELKSIAGGWRLYTKADFHELIERMVVSQDTRRMTSASRETLAIVAYLQPVTRAGVSALRGVNSDSPINSLLEKGLICEAGTADSPGNPIVYATTARFLEKYALNSIDDLPSLEQFAPDDDTKRRIEERLGIASLPSYLNEGGMQQARLDFGEKASEIVDDFAKNFSVVQKIDFDTLKIDFDEE